MVNGKGFPIEKRKGHKNMKFTVSFSFFVFFNILFQATAIADDQRDILNYCIKNDCDYGVFYDFYKVNYPKFCTGRKAILNNANMRRILSTVALEVRSSGLNMSVSAIPIMESSLNKNGRASSHANAALGLWQFKPSTARDMGLIVNDSIDERLDVKKSTKAAIKYIKWLEKRYDGNHNLAVLAYHVGTGRLSRNITKFGTDNPWFLAKLINEKNPDSNYLLKYHSYSLSLMGKNCS